MLNKLRLLTPGPTPLPENVRLALSKDMIHHRKEDFKNIMLKVQKGTRILFGTKNPVLPLSCSGTGAMTAAVYNLFNPGEKVLVVESGKFGQRWREIAQSRGLSVTTIKTLWGDAVKVEQITNAIESQKDINGLLIQQSETSTGVLQPIKEIASFLTNKDILLVVDGISGVGISPCPMDEWGIDCLLTGSQKGLMLPPGLALIALSDKAWKKTESVKTGCFYFDLQKERKSNEKFQSSFTTPINLIFGLDASLDFLLQDGLQKVYAKQWALTMLVRNGASKMGLELLAKDNYTWGITSICLPSGVDGQEVLKIALSEYGVCMAGGQDELKGKIVRLGHMGWVDWSDCLAGLYALEKGILKVGAHLASRDYLEYAMSAYNNALNKDPGIPLKDDQIRA